MSSSSTSPKRRRPASRSTSTRRARSSAPTSRVIGGSDWSAAAGSDIVVITSGKPRKPGMSRDDLVRDNFDDHEEHRAEAGASTRPNAIVVPVANPLDAMSQALFRLTKFPRERVIGMAGVLDSARMSTFIAMELNVSVENVHSFVLGGHGDTMVPLPRYSTVAGIPITELLSKETHRRDLRSARPTAAPRSPSWSARAPGTRPVRPRREMVRGDPQGQEEDPAVLGVPAGRVRRSTICSSACR